MKPQDPSRPKGINPPTRRPRPPAPPPPPMQMPANMPGTTPERPRT